MARTQYVPDRIIKSRRPLIDYCNAVCEEYAEAGMVLTLRQLYYQLVARAVIDNSDREYSKLSGLCNDARMAGLMDWNYLIDRNRSLRSVPFWDGPEDLITKSAKQYNRDLWKPQHHRVEVWIEKDAAIGTVESVCNENRVPYFSTRGYSSVSALHDAAQRIRGFIEKGDDVTILHIGDHDPSGVDMTRDLEERVRTFISVDWAGLHMGPGRWTRGDLRQDMRRHMAEKRGVDALELGAVVPWRIKRIALTMDQVEEYGPPPNPAKLSDSRARAYIEQYGRSSWELDALEPIVLASLIQDEVDAVRDEDLWGATELEMELERRQLTAAAAHWYSIRAHLTDVTGDPSL